MATIYNLPSSANADYAHWRAAVDQWSTTIGVGAETTAKLAATIQAVGPTVNALTRLFNLDQRAEKGIFMPLPMGHEQRSSSVFVAPSLGSDIMRKVKEQEINGMLDQLGDQGRAENMLGGMRILELIEATLETDRLTEEAIGYKLSLTVG